MLEVWEKLWEKIALAENLRTAGVPVSADYEELKRRFLGSVACKHSTLLQTLLAT